MNTTKVLSSSMAIVVILGVSLPDSIAQQIITPHSGIEKPEDVGKKAHTTFKILVPKGFPKFDETKPTNPIAGKPAEPVLPPPIIEQEALDRLKLMSEKLATAKAFTYRSRSTLEIPAKTGQFLTHFTESDVALERPNKLRYFVTGDVPSFQFYYDGTHASVLDIKKNLYATTQAPATIDEMLPFVMEKYNNDFFSADFLFSNPYAEITKGLTHAIVVGPANVNGVSTEHFAFMNPAANWEIWIDAGQSVFPRRVAVTYKSVENFPRFLVEFQDWNLKPKADAGQFVFMKPAGAKQVEFGAKAEKASQ